MPQDPFSHEFSWEADIDHILGYDRDAEDA